MMISIGIRLRFVAVAADASKARIGAGNRSIGRSAVFTCHSNRESAADLTHSLITESAEAFYKRSDRHALNRIEIDDGPPWDRIVTRIEQHLARYSTDRGCAWPDQSASKSWNRSISGEHYDRATSGLWNLTPPDLSAGPGVRSRSAGGLPERVEIPPLVRRIEWRPVVCPVRSIDLSRPVAGAGGRRAPRR